MLRLNRKTELKSTWLGNLFQLLITRSVKKVDCTQIAFGFWLCKVTTIIIIVCTV